MYAYTIVSTTSTRQTHSELCQRDTKKDVLEDRVSLAERIASSAVRCFRLESYQVFYRDATLPIVMLEKHRVSHRQIESHLLASSTPVRNNGLVTNETGQSQTSYLTGIANHTCWYHRLRYGKIDVVVNERAVIEVGKRSSRLNQETCSFVRKKGVMVLKHAQRKHRYIAGT